LKNSNWKTRELLGAVGDKRDGFTLGMVRHETLSPLVCNDELLKSHNPLAQNSL